MEKIDIDLRRMEKSARRRTNKLKRRAGNRARREARREWNKIPTIPLECAGSYVFGEYCLF